MRYLPVYFLAGVNRALQFLSIQLGRILVLLLYFKYVHQNHIFFLLLHILYVTNDILNALLNFSVSANCWGVGTMKFMRSSLSWIYYFSPPSGATAIFYSSLIISPEGYCFIAYSGTIPSKYAFKFLASLLQTNTILSSLSSLLVINHLGSPVYGFINLYLEALLKLISMVAFSEFILI